MSVLNATGLYSSKGFPGSSDGEESAFNAGLLSLNAGLIPGLGRSRAVRKWQPTPVFLPGEFHGQRCLAGYSPWGLKESYTTEGLTFTYFICLGINKLSHAWLSETPWKIQARILEWVAFAFSRGSSQPRDGTLVSRIAGRFFTS